MAQNRFYNKYCVWGPDSPDFQSPNLFEFVDQAYKFFFSQKAFGSNFFWAEA